MRPGPVVRLALVPLLAIAVAVAIGTWASARQPDPRSSLTSALDSLPEATLVAGFTDWAAIRSDLDLGSASTGAARTKLAERGVLRDLTTRSVLGGLIADMHAAYGWSAADLEWETYGQAPDGAAMVARFSGSVSIGDVERRLRSLGYTSRDGVWTLSEVRATDVGPELAATLGNLAIDTRRRLVVAATRADHVRDVLEVIRGDEPSALSVRALNDVAASLAGSDTVLLQSGPFACRSTSLSQLGPDVLAQADAAVARAGALVAPTFTGRGLVDGRDAQSIRFAAAFGSPAQAAEQLRVRTALATGPFIGRSGRVEDALDLRSATVDGSVAVLRFALDPDEGAFMSGEGPALFAGCPRG
ncbi:hypothetical protein [Aeromicrobium wangtongii]|uniref:Peptidoglycan binding domain-containing protein n=1 Tax=Aeromicrobium wangtongii TaxID=2969247 RepID=A0ABY5M7M7_9ACTN|nr:hypothetical protein [Aeromicrobium wangtongii]MCD9196657.1 hypothetical protein [Aeromicrobium wangtongii]UUP14168.1 hypothetical protein NQV15_02315 [Aeromicrobium wangtongii]